MKIQITRILCILVVALSLFACREEIDKANRYTFTGETVADYILNRSEHYSHMINLMKRANILSLLSTYGRFTLFLPDNAAVEKYVAEQDSIYWATKDTKFPLWTGVTSPFVEELSDSMANVIARTHVIQTMHRMAEMGEGALASRNFNYRLLGINYVVKGEQYYIMLNNSAAIISGDHQVENGIIHLTDKVIAPSQKNVPELIGVQQFFKIFTSAMTLTGFSDSLKLDNDPNYDHTKYKAYHYILQTEYSAPETRFHKYTGFIEPDEVFNSYGIHNIDDLKAFAEKWYGTEEKGNYKSPKNALYKFVAYHFVECELPHNKIVPYDIYKEFDEYMPTRYDRYDYFETMLGPLMKVMKPLSTPNGRDTYINYSKREQPYNKEMHSHLNVRVIPLTEFIKMKDEYAEFDQMASNGIVHPIDKILLYNENEMVGNILDERIRIDLISLIPELSSNNVRYNPYTLAPMVPDIYSKRLKITRGNVIIDQAFMPAKSNADMITLDGIFDVEFTIPPLPPRVYEIRLAFITREPNNSIYPIGPMQIYIDGKPEGLPFGAPNEITGYEDDSETLDNGVENDKHMRNLGWMKGPITYYYGNGIPSRQRKENGRKIIARKYLDAGYHKIRFRLISEYPTEHHLDFLEFVPLHIVNDPVIPEDRY